MEIGEFRELLAERKARGERLEGVDEASPQVQASTRARGALPDPRRPGQRSVRRGRGRDGGAPLHAASSRQRRAHEVYRRASGHVLQVTVIEFAMIGLDCRAGRRGPRLFRAGAPTRLLGGLVADRFPPPSGAPALIGLATALAILVGFALPPMLQLKRVPPARVLRRNLEPAAAALLHRLRACDRGAGRRAVLAGA